MDARISEHLKCKIQTILDFLGWCDPQHKCGVDRLVITLWDLAWISSQNQNTGFVLVSENPKSHSQDLPEPGQALVLHSSHSLLV